MDLIVFVARAALAIVFAVAGLAKLADRAGTRALAISFGVPSALAGAFELLLPLAELACAIALLPSATATIGAIGTLVLLILFILAIVMNLARGRRPECRCFGQIHSAPVGWTTVARNVLLSALAVLVIMQGSAGRQPGISEALAALTNAPIIWAVVLSLTGLIAVAALVMTYQLLKQNGRLALRVEALEARLGPEERREPGLAVGTMAPAYSANGHEEGKVLLFFKAAGCGACEAMLPEVANWQRAHKGLLNIVTIEDKRVSDAYLVDATPSAVLIDAGKVASPLATGDEAIRSLVATATAPPPYAKGDLVASLELPDLDGRSVDLGQLAGRRTVLLFWSPTCGFCVDALEDVKWWERHRDPQLSDLLVITSGDAEANRAQGFQSPVLLDAGFVAGNRFGAGGTPSAVLVDEMGRVASDVAIGAPEVLALAGSSSPARP